jgi:hypothetical protein
MKYIFMTQTSSILIKIGRIAGKTSWDKIPQSVVDAYEEEIAQLHKTTRGRSFKEACIATYNQYFAEYGYTKPICNN